MKTATLMAALLVLAAAVTPAHSQDPGDIGVFFDAAGTMTTGTITPFVNFDVYVVAFDTPGGIAGFEGSIQRDLSLILVSTVIAGCGPLNVGTPENWIVGTGCCLPSSGPVVLMHFQYMCPIIPAPTDMLFCVGPSSPSSLPGATGPAWLDCADNILPFGQALNGGGVYPDGCAVGNPTGLAPVATEHEDWGSIKSLYR